MTVPAPLIHASRDFERFQLDARAELGLATTHQTYAAVFGVLVTFRARLTPEQALRFADALPPLLAALFLRDWAIAPPKPFGERAALTREVQGVRADHNLAPDSVITDTARALRAHVDARAFEAALATLPEGAAVFWRV